MGKLYKRYYAFAMEHAYTVFRVVVILMLLSGVLFLIFSKILAVRLIALTNIIVTLILIINIKWIRLKLMSHPPA